MLFRSTGLFLEHGKVSFDGAIERTISKYLRANLSENSHLNEFTTGKPGDALFEVNKVYLKDIEGNFTNKMEISKPFSFFIDFNVKEKCYVKFSFIIKNSEGIELFASLNNHEPNFYNSKLETGNYVSEVKLPGDLLNKGQYFITILCSSEFNWNESFVMEDVLLLDCEDDGVRP